MTGSSEALNLVRSALKFYLGKKSFGKFLEKVVITAAGDGHCKAEFTVDEDMTNPGGTLHGGCTATVVDVISTLGLLSHKNKTPGVSVNISVNYLKGAKPGDNILIESKAVKVGKNLAYLDVMLTNKDTGVVIACGSHIKYIGS